MKIVVDTNIIFSAILNSNNTIGDIIFNSDAHFEFYSSSYMRFEIQKHWSKLKKISKLNDNQLQISYDYLISKIKFINEEIIPKEVWLEAEEISKGIDIDDVDFIALTNFLKPTLWTGDKRLYAGLKQAKFKEVLNTPDLLELRSVKIRTK